jgi:outer membrane protein TolC
MRAKAELLQAQADLDQAYRDIKAAQQELKNQLGIQDAFPLIATGILITPKFAAEVPLFDPIVQSHPKTMVQKASLSVADANVRSAKSVYWPNVTASYSRLLSGPDYFPDQPNWIASGVLNLPIFGSGITSAAYSVSENKRIREKAEADLHSIENQLRSNLESAWASVVGTAQQVEVQEAFLEAARQRNVESDVRYSSGLMTYENWEIVVTDLVNFERSSIRAERDAMVSESAWNSALGKTLEEQ